jgi:hypothetical protein
MRRKLLIGLGLLNALLALVLLAGLARSQIFPNGIFNCCKTAGAETNYCCINCCWFIPNCNGDDDCQDQ